MTDRYIKTKNKFRRMQKWIVNINGHETEVNVPNSLAAKWEREAKAKSSE